MFLAGCGWLLNVFGWFWVVVGGFGSLWAVLASFVFYN